jgi:hypothetical protein
MFNKNALELLSKVGAPRQISNCYFGLLTNSNEGDAISFTEDPEKVLIHTDICKLSRPWSSIVSEATC